MQKHDNTIRSHNGAHWLSGRRRRFLFLGDYLTARTKRRAAPKAKGNGKHPALAIEQVATGQLKPAPYNPRTMTDEARRRLEHLIREHGLVDPIIARRKDRLVVGGHQRLVAAKKLGLATVPVVFLDLSDAEAKALNVALNNPAAQGAWDETALSSLLAELDAGGFDLTLTGFDESELAEIMSSGNGAGEESPDVDLTPPAKPKSKRGEVYELGRHRLLCGDAYSVADLKRLHGETKPDLLHIDPPYGISTVKVKSNAVLGSVGAKKAWGSVGAPGMIAVGLYPVIEGDDRPFDPAAFLAVAPVVILWGANYYADKLPVRSSWICWDKREGITRNNFADGELAWCSAGGPLRIFHHLWSGLFKGSQHGERRTHPTEKPTALFAEIGKLYADGGIWCDYFAGTGAQLIAAEQTGATCYALEIEPAYCDVIRRRYAELVGKPKYAP